MTFLELERECKKRRLKRFFLLFFVVLMVFVGGGFYFFKNKKEVVKNVKIQKKPKKVEKNQVLLKEQNVTKKIVKKIAKKVEKTKKSSNSLKFVVDFKDLNISLFNQKEIKKPKENESKNSVILVSKVLPSYQTCILLSEEYYKKGDYQKALTWAKNANLQDNKKPESWILTAKALNKLGKKEEAIKVLKIYYDYTKNKEVLKLLKELSND